MRSDHNLDIPYSSHIIHIHNVYTQCNNVHTKQKYNIINILITYIWYYINKNEQDFLYQKCV